MNWLKENQIPNIPNTGKLGPISYKDMERIVRYSNINNISECWIWNGTINDKKGKGHQHGSFWYNQKYVLIHRLMYHNYVRSVPVFEHNGLRVNHKCSHFNNGKCINPYHMYLGTPKDNIRDCIKDGNKNRISSGELNPNARVSDINIKRLFENNPDLSQYELALKIGVNQSTISRWVNNINRKNFND